MSANAQPQAQPNRLARETSPYLLQHARNPVDWFAWGPEAFAEARRRNVPIFLSVGYSTCYWCHVMERESFEDPATGAVMSERFVCIKVDREVRPDVDDIYMHAVQLLTRRGGWPMSVWLTPPGARSPDDRGLEPFYAGTYFPGEARHGMPAFRDVLANVSDAWRSQRDAVLEQAARVTEAVREQLASSRDAHPIGAEQVGNAIAMLLRMYDRQAAGFGRAPKFPQPVFAGFLMEVIPSIEDPAIQSAARHAVRHTLDRMALGGMYDQVGGGFHRYSVDDQWLVPHFEKMLYDNGQLASLYARSLAAAAPGGDDAAFDAWVLRRTLDYVLGEMTDASGAFWSAQDAEVNHREGQNYLWTRAELDAVLGADDGAFAAKVFGVDGGPNFRDPHHPDEPMSNVLFMSDRPGAAARAMGMDPAVFSARLADVSRRLYEARARRDQPGTDDKVIVAWNGLMIAGLAEGAAALRDAGYLDAARRAARTILSTMRGSDGGLLRAARGGAASTPAFLEDYAMLMRGVLAIHRAGAALGVDDGWALAEARGLWQQARERFADPERPGVLFDTLADQSDLIVRTSATYDGAMPGGPSEMLNALIDLYDATGDDGLLREALDITAALSRAIGESPVGAVHATRGLFRLLKIDRAAVEERLGTLAAGARDSTVHLDEAPVQIFASDDRVVVGASGGTLDIELRIADGFHVTAREPGVDGLVPMSIEISGGSGVTAVADYPAGVPYRGGALPPEEAGMMRIYSGAIPLTIRLARTGEPWNGRPMLHVTYQACTDEACFQPVTVELDVAIDPG